MPMKWKRPSPGVLNIAFGLMIYAASTVGIISVLLLILPNALGMGYSLVGLPFYSMFCGPSNSGWLSNFISVPGSSQGYYEFLLSNSSRDKCVQDYTPPAHRDGAARSDSNGPAQDQPPSPGIVESDPTQPVFDATNADGTNTSGMAAQPLNQDQSFIGTEFGQYNDTYAGLSQFWGNHIIGHFFETLARIFAQRFREGVQTGAVFLINFLRTRAIFSAAYYLLYSILTLALTTVLAVTVTIFTSQLLKREPAG
jgi:hypothetical protein